MCHGYHKYCSIKCSANSLEVKEKWFKTNLEVRGKNGKLFFTESHKAAIANANKGKIHLEKTKEKMSNSHKGKTFSEEHKQNLSGKIPWNKGKKDSVKIRKRKSIAGLNRMEKHGMTCFPYEGNNEKVILNQIQNATNISILRNDRKISKIIKGKSCDGYSPKYNLIIEILELYHFNKTTCELVQYDLDRQAIISERLGCMIYYIPEQKFLKNPEKEIHRFKDFLSLLDEGVN